MSHPSCPYGDKDCPKNKKIEHMLVAVITLVITNIGLVVYV